MQDSTLSTCGEGASGWIAYRAGARAPRLRLYCFPYAGGSAAAYRGWGGSLPAGVQLCPVEQPGRGTRFAERGHTRLLPLAAAIAGAIAPELDVPCAFFGHSLGAAVAFEVARELRRRRAGQPRHLVVSARPPPRRPLSHPFTHGLPDEEFAEAVRLRYGVAVPRRELEPAGAPAGPARLFGLILSGLRADVEMHETYVYRPEPPLGCAVSAWAGAEDPLVPPEDMAGWREETAGSFARRTFPGHHFYQRTEERQVLAALGGLLEEAVARAA